MQLKDDLNVVEFPTGLALRTGDTYALEKWTGPGDLSVPTYAVALFEAPSLLVLDVPVSLVANPTGVVAAGLTQDGWGWVPLEPHTRDYLGDFLDKVGARPGEWFKLTITYTNPLQS